MIRRHELPELQIGGKVYPNPRHCVRCGKEACICDPTAVGSDPEIDSLGTIVGFVVIVLYVATFVGTVIGLSYCALQGIY
jgi:hypothetical protein